MKSIWASGVIIICLFYRYFNKLFYIQVTFCVKNNWKSFLSLLCAGSKKYTFGLFVHFTNFCPLTALPELIYKEVMNFEERTKNGVVKGQPSPSGTLSA